MTKKPNGDHPEPAPRHKIVSLAVSGGFLDGVALEFAEGFNCIVGANGTGKTTALEFLGYALGVTPASETGSNGSEASKAVRKALVNGRLGVTVETRHGVRYVSERTLNTPARVLDESGAVLDVSLGAGSLFQAHICSGREIRRIASRPSLQLGLIDRFATDDMQRVDSEIRKISSELADDATHLVRLEQQIGKLREETHEAKTLEERLKGLMEKAGPNAEKLNSAHHARAAREKERRALDLLREDVQKTVAGLEAETASRLTGIRSRCDQHVLRGENEGTLVKVARDVDAFTKAVEQALAIVKKEASTAREALDGHAAKLSRLHAAQEEAYSALVQTSAEAQKRATERNQLQVRHAEVASAQRELDARTRELDTRVTRRRSLLAQLSTLRDERFQTRKRVAAHLSRELADDIRVSVVQGGRRLSYRRLLTKALRGQRIQYRGAVDAIVNSLDPDELAKVVRAPGVQELAKRTGLTPERAKKVLDVLGEGPHLYRIEAVELEDRARLVLRDETEYKDWADQSPGQRRATILSILLLLGDGVLVVDQPEDDLDNASVFSTVVKQIKAAKGRRQLIFVTHNPNIAVVGQADRVFVFRSTGKRASVAFSGTVEELREPIEKILEGGREPFQFRQKVYQR